jgi:type 1 fimbria pilin
MANKFLSRKTAIITLVATAGLGGGVAYAYPSGTAMTVSASASATTPGGNAPVMVTVSNVNPACQTLVSVDDGSSVLLPPGATTTTITISSSPGRHSVTARTVDCPKGEKEHAKSKFVIVDASVTAPPTAKVKKNYEVDYAGLEPDSIVTVTATLPGSSPLKQLVESDSVDRRGAAKVKFKFPTTGTWSVSTSVSPSGTPVNPFTVNVTP